MGDAVRRCEVVGNTCPATGFNAGDGDLLGAPRGDENGGLKHAILFRTDDLFAVVEHHLGVERVVDQQLGDVPGRVNFFDRETEGLRRAERDVVGKSGCGSQERNDRDAAVDLGGAGAEVEWEGGGDLFGELRLHRDLPSVVCQQKSRSKR